MLNIGIKLENYLILQLFIFLSLNICKDSIRVRICFFAGEKNVGGLSES